MGLMSHIREASKVTINISYFHPAHQHCKFRNRRRSDTSEIVGHLNFLRPQVVVGSGNSFENTLLHITPKIPLLYL
jgi:hypothetical protein